jgi:flagellar biogenesis protein FliO
MRIVLRITAVLLLVAGTAFAAPKAATPPKKLPGTKIMTTLGLIDGESDDKGTTITVRLDKKPTWGTVPELQNHGAFLQLVLPETIVPEPGKFFDGGSPFVPKIAVFQLTPSEAGIRFFLASDAAKTRAALSSALLDNRIVLTLDHQKLATDLAESQPVETLGPVAAGAAVESAATETPEEIPDYVDAIAKVESAESVIARTQIDRELPPPAEVLKAEAPASAAVASAASAAAPMPLPKTSGAEAGAKPAALVPKPGVAKATAAKALAAAAPLAPLEEDGSLKRLGSNAGIDLREKLVQVTLFFGAMLGLLLLSFAMRSTLRRRTRALTGEQPIDMKMLASLPLASRQKLSLVQVGDERILIGVTPENVTFIANLSKQAAPAAFGKILAQAEQLAAPAREPRTLPMAPAPRPKLKDLPGNDEESLREPPAPRPAAPAPAAAAPAPATKKPAPQRVNIAVGDDGPKEVAAVKRSRPADNKPASRESVDDVTKMIRDKLRQLKSI